MGKIKPKSVPPKELYKLLDEFYSIVTLLESKEEVKNFFKDLFSTSEALMVARRIQIAKLLLSGSSYETIRQKLAASFTTIGNVQRWLDAGFGGYLKALENLNKKLAEKEAAYAKSASRPFSGLKSKYPAYFAISGMLEQFSKWNQERQKRKKRKDF
jgi:TrpR-related protein YerC/YecD